MNLGERYGEAGEGPCEAEGLLLRDAREIARKEEVLTGVAEIERVGTGWEHIYRTRVMLDPRKKYSLSS